MMKNPQKPPHNHPVPLVLIGKHSPKKPPYQNCLNPCYNIGNSLFFLVKIKETQKNIYSKNRLNITEKIFFVL